MMAWILLLPPCTKMFYPASKTGFKKFMNQTEKEVAVTAAAVGFF